MMMTVRKLILLCALTSAVLASSGPRGKRGAKAKGSAGRLARNSRKAPATRARGRQAYGNLNKKKDKVPVCFTCDKPIKEDELRSVGVANRKSKNGHNGIKTLHEGCVYKYLMSKGMVMAPKAMSAPTRPCSNRSSLSSTHLSTQSAPAKRDLSPLRESPRRRSPRDLERLLKGTIKRPRHRTTAEDSMTFDNPISGFETDDMTIVPQEDMTRGFGRDHREDNLEDLDNFDTASVFSGQTDLTAIFTLEQDDILGWKLIDDDELSDFAATDFGVGSPRLPEQDSEEDCIPPRKSVTFKDSVDEIEQKSEERGTQHKQRIRHHQQLVANNKRELDALEARILAAIANDDTKTLKSLTKEVRRLSAEAKQLSQTTDEIENAVRMS